MKSCGSTVLAFFVLGMLAGAPQRTSLSKHRWSARLARPNQIYVYDFIADPTQIPADSAISADLSRPSTPPTAEDLETGRKLGALIAQDLAAAIQAIGFSAVHVQAGASPQVGGGVIRGYLVSVEGGSAAKRFVIGFGSGTSEMDTVVEGYAVAPQGWRKLGSGTLSSSGNKMPGMVSAIM